MKRKILIGLLSVTCASAAAFGLAACGDGSNSSGNNGDNPKPDAPNYPPPEDSGNELLKFELNDYENGYIVTGLADGVTNASIIIPATYNSLPVVAIGERAFGSCSTLTSVTISQGISEIGSGAFTGCINIPSFKFPESITVIGDSAFQNCTGLKAISFIGTSQLEELSANTFQGCTNLTSITVPDSVESIGDRAFQNCTSIKKAVIGNGVETIGKETFRGCEKLEQVTIGNSLKTVGEMAFLDCSKISEMHFPLSLKSVGLGALSGCTGIKSLTIPFVGSEKYSTPLPDPESEEEYSKNHTNFGWIFGANSFSDNYKLKLDNLETVTITGDSPIGFHAFESIGRFKDASETDGIGLKTVIIKGNVKIIGTGAFALCYNLQTLVLPKSLTTIGNQILDVGVIKHVYYCGTQADWDKIPGVNSSNNHGLFEVNTSGLHFPDPKYYYSESQPATEGNFWHYVDGVPTPW